MRTEKNILSYTISKCNMQEMIHVPKYQYFTLIYLELIVSSYILIIIINQNLMLKRINQNIHVYVFYLEWVSSMTIN